jgi:hypothetical protein
MKSVIISTIKEISQVMKLAKEEMTPSKKFSLFLSHRTSDKPKIEELFTQLKVLLPNFPISDLSGEVPYVENWKTPALKLIQTCDVFVCIVGSETYKSDNVNWEIIEAHKSGRPIIITTLSNSFPLPKACEEFNLQSAEWHVQNIAGQIAELLVPHALFSNHNWEEGNPAPSEIMDQYKLMVQSWEALIERRQKVNTIYLSAVSAILALIGGLFSSSAINVVTYKYLSVIFLSFLGVFLSYNWKRTIHSYGILSKAKSKVVTAIEGYLPAQIFDTEWKVLESKKYKSTTETDLQTALFFFILFCLIILLTTIVLVRS